MQKHIIPRSFTRTRAEGGENIGRLIFHHPNLIHVLLNYSVYTDATTHKIS